MELDDFQELMVHSKSRDNTIEQTNKYGFKLDNQDGISVALGFGENQLSKADYIQFENDDVKFVELSDLGRQFAEAACNLNQLRQDYLQANVGKKLTAKVDRKLKKKAFQEVKSELSQKWSGSIATFERLIRVKPGLTQSPRYSYVVVCKNDNDLRAVEHVSTMMQGMCNSFTLLNTKDF
jgi:hypothetical protein